MALPLESLSAMDGTARKMLIAFAAVGIVTVGSLALTLCRHLLTFATRTVLAPNLRKKYGDWSVVSGATDGIGKAYCHELARQKINLAVMGRTKAKVDELCAELEGKYGVRTKAIVEDLAEADQGTFDRISAALDGVEVGLLINNVGMSYPHAKYFTEVDSKLIDDLIKVNVYTTTKLTQVVLPGMWQRKRGAVVFIGSGSATVLPTDPLYGVYAGAKGYVEQFARALAVECRPRNVDVQLQAPLFVATKMAKIRRGTLTAPSPKVYAKWGAAAIGAEDVCTPYWVHTVMWGIIACMPPKIWDAIRMSQVLTIRKRAMAKKAKAKAN